MASKTDALNFMGMNYFVLEPVPEDLICPICHELLNEPVQTPCGHLFCKECFIQARLIQSEATPEKTSNSPKNRKRKKGKSAYCPLCRAHFKGEPYSDKYNDRRVKSLKVKCPNLPCSWTGMLSSIRQHRTDEKGCKYEVVSCPKRCTEKIHRVHLKTHIELKCIYREKSCEYCGLTVPIDQLQEHYQMCVEVPVYCPNECGEKTLHQHAVEGHLELCPGQVIQCPYHTLGCEDVIMRKYIHTHQEEAKDKHLELALKKVMKLSEAVSVLSLNFTRISQQYRELSQNTAIRDMDTVDTSQYTQVAVRSWLKNTTHFPSMPWIVKMSNIPANTKWYSKPFYTSLTGYKLCLLVCFNSSEEENDSQYISVSLF